MKLAESHGLLVAVFVYLVPAGSALMSRFLHRGGEEEESHATDEGDLNASTQTLALGINDFIEDTGNLHTLHRNVPGFQAGLFANEDQKKTFDEALGKKLAEKMKYFPAMTSLQELLEWNATVGGPRMGASKDVPVLRDGRRIVAVHDMAGGYAEMPDNDYLQMFQSWDMVDLFVYFSHVRVSVPPIQWTAIAHEHKRPVLGTLILEPGQGSLDATDVIKTHRSAVLKQMVSVADHYGFDGWFVNVEGGGWDAGDPAKFVGELKTMMKEKVGTHSQVIAYPYGPEHTDMFNAADGVFINYNWPDSDTALAEVAKAAGNRTNDVYMGMDAFGGTRGNTQPDALHVSACAKHELSAAVFAPGYTLEVVAKRKISLRAVDFDRRYWSAIGKNFGRDGAAGDGNMPVEVLIER